MHKKPNQKAHPFLKWAGGKNRLLENLSLLLPEELKNQKIHRYAEPFLGGGAMFFHIARDYPIKQFILSDVNGDLILAYRTIRDNPGKLMEHLETISKEYLQKTPDERKNYYYHIRNDYNREKQHLHCSGATKDPAKLTAMILFLNKTCYNGLFRVNKENLFNVPHGRYKNPKILDRENIISVWETLQGVRIEHGDFEDLEESIDGKTFVYLDPPYRPISRTSSFKSYMATDFGDSQQIRLAGFFRRLHSKGAKLMLSNSDPKNHNREDDFFEDLYRGFNIRKIQANRMINSNPNRRGKIIELVITNY